MNLMVLEVIPMLKNFIRILTLTSDIVHKEARMEVKGSQYIAF